MGSKKRGKTTQNQGWKYPDPDPGEFRTNLLWLNQNMLFFFISTTSGYWKTPRCIICQSEAEIYSTTDNEYHTNVT